MKVLSSWYLLPVELLRSIAEFLKNNPEDLRNLRLVCSNWQHAIRPISSLLPYKTLFSSSVYLLRRRRCGRDTDQPWLVISMESTKGKLQLYHPLLEHPIPDIPDNFTLHDNQELNPCLLSVNYHTNYSSNNDKVLLISRNNSSPFTLDDCSLLVLSESGLLHWSLSVEPENQCISFCRFKSKTIGSYVSKFDDILNFNDVVYVLDRKGRLYQLITKQFPPVIEILVRIPIVRVNKGWRKRLVGSSIDNTVYMVAMDDLNYKLKVYRFCEYTKNTSKWIKVESFVGDQVLFLSKHYCFFAEARYFPDCQLGNCIIFYDELPLGETFKFPEEIQVFWLRGGGHGFKPISSYPGFPAINLFSAPIWISQAHMSSCQSYSQR